VRAAVEGRIVAIHLRPDNFIALCDALPMMDTLTFHIKDRQSQIVVNTDDGLSFIAMPIEVMKGAE
jgi:hypothetical protein